jgi:ribA/ribD-fused uncharacterized protein
MPVSATISQHNQQSTPANTAPVYFWKPNQGHGYLSQWYWSPFIYNGDTYHTAEMWMMIQKARLFGDEKVAQRMLATQDPKTHKALGREVKGFDEKTWDSRTCLYFSLFCISDERLND